MNSIRNFMLGRYGSDRFSLALMIFALILSIFLGFVPVPYIRVISYIPLAFAFFRILSQNTYKRQRENLWFLKYWNKISRWFKNISQEFKNRQAYKYFKCPNCKQQLRAPRGKGKIKVTCQRCKREFIKKI